MTQTLNQQSIDKKPETITADANVHTVANIDTQSQILVVGNEHQLPVALQTALAELSLHTTVCGFSEVFATLEKLPGIKAAILLPDSNRNAPGSSHTVVHEILEAASLITLDLSHQKNSSKITTPNTSPISSQDDNRNLIIHADANETSEMLKGRLIMLMELARRLALWQQEMERIKKIGKPVTEHLDAMDQEMILAARLQQDFLPRQLPNVTGVKFAAVYRPASWVSGDIYDVMRLDEDHIGFYVADVVGHGMPAALLTMFIKRAIITKRIEANSYELIAPGEVLSQLNDDMVNQNLSNFQFATGCYGLLNHKTMQLQLANAGHPLPLLIDTDGQTTELQGHGSLLGVFPNQTFRTYDFQLPPGSKLLFYSDGVELAFINEGPDKPLRFRKEFSDLAREDIDTMCSRLIEIIEQEEGSLHPRDDVTIVALQIEGI